MQCLDVINCLGKNLDNLLKKNSDIKTERN